jgi:hypothetical protein
MRSFQPPQQPSRLPHRKREARAMPHAGHRSAAGRNSRSARALVCRREYRRRANGGRAQQIRSNRRPGEAQSRRSGKARHAGNRRKPMPRLRRQRPDRRRAVQDLRRQRQGHCRDLRRVGSRIEARRDAAGRANRGGRPRGPRSCRTAERRDANGRRRSACSRKMNRPGHAICA